MAIVTRPCSSLSMGKQLTGYMLISLIFAFQSVASYSVAQLLNDDNQTNQISLNQSTVPADNETIVNSTTPVSSHQMSSSTPSSQPSIPPEETSTTTETPITSTTLPPPLPTPLPSKGHPKLYSGSPQSIYLAMGNLLKSKASYLGRTKRMKRSRPNLIKADSTSGNNPFSLIKFLLTNHLPSPNDYPSSYSLADSKPGQFGSVYSSNLDQSLDRNDFSSGPMINNIHSRVNPEQSASFYPLTASDLEALELGEGYDEAFDSGFGGDGWNNQGTIDLINQLETDGSNGNNNNDLYPLDPFIPLRSFRSTPSRAQSELLIRPVIAMKRKRRPNGSYTLTNGVERSPNSIILGSSLFGGGDNRYRSRSNNNQYEQLINRINDNPAAYL